MSTNKHTTSRAGARVALPLSLAACWLACAVDAVRADAAAVQQAQAMVAAGQYPEALKVISQTLTKGSRDGGATDKAERHELLMLRGECLLRTGQQSAAASAFEAAGKGAPDVRGTALGRASALLVRASRQNKYTPKSAGGGGQPIDIVDEASRRQAFAALHDDLAAAVRPKVEKAMEGKSLPPMLDVLPSLLDVGYAEAAATGSAERTRGQLKDLGDRARELMNADIRAVRMETEVLEGVANATEENSRRGLFSKERRGLEDAVTHLRRIEQTARDARRRAIELGFDGSAWEPVIADAADQADRTQALLSVGS